MVAKIKKCYILLESPISSVKDPEDFKRKLRENPFQDTGSVMHFYCNIDKTLRTLPQCVRVSGECDIFNIIIHDTVFTIIHELDESWAILKENTSEEYKTELVMEQVAAIQNSLSKSVLKPLFNGYKKKRE